MPLMDADSSVRRTVEISVGDSNNVYVAIVIGGATSCRVCFVPATVADLDRAGHS